MSTNFNHFIKYFVVLCCFSTLISCKTNQQSATKNTTGLSQFNTVFKQGDNGYACFRIPAIVVANNGHILAFAEARKTSCSDTGDIDLVMKKSTNNGKSWSPLTVLFNDGNNVCGNPAPVVNVATGTIHLVTTWNHGDDHESEIIAGTSKYSREVFHMFSNDNGNSWSKPKNITKSVKLPNWSWYATGPVHGIQIKNGAYKERLVISSNHITKDDKKYYSHCIFSDDNGLNWQLGGISPNEKVNESTVSELDSVVLMLNMRNYQRDSIKGRQLAFSFDGGSTWKNQYIEKNLPEPICQGASLTIYRNNKNVQLFSNPSNTDARKNMAISISRNNGKTWKSKIKIFENHAAYSDLTELKNGKIMILFEAGNKNAYEGIYTKIISIK